MPNTAQQSTARTRAPIDPREAMKAGEKALTGRSRSKADPNAFYVKELKEAGGFHRKAFELEIAVCLHFYAAQLEGKAGDADKVEKKTKAALRPIYEKAGYDCKTPKGEDYKTVQRRISVAADLFSFLGGVDTISDWCADLSGQEALGAVVRQLEKQKLDSIQAIQVKVGKGQPKKTKAAPAPAPAPAQATVPAPQPEGAAAPDETDKALAASVAGNIAARQAEGGQPAKAPGERRMEDALPTERILKTEHLMLAIPFETTKEELMKLATDVLAFAATLTTQAAIAAPAAV